MGAFFAPEGWNREGVCKDKGIPSQYLFFSRLHRCDLSCAQKSFLQYNATCKIGGARIIKELLCSAS